MSLPALIVAALTAGLFVGGTVTWQVQGWRHDAQRAEELAEAQRINIKRESVSAEVGAKTVAAAERIRTVTRTQIVEVPTYVSANDCLLSPGFRMLHDAAAEGELPDPSGIADAAAVPAPDLAQTVVSNYGACTEQARRLSDLQDWIRMQQKIR